MLIDQNTFFAFTSKGHCISTGCVKILEILKGKGAGCILGADFWKIKRGGGVMRQIPSLGVVWIFSGTTHYKSNLFQKKLEGGFISVYFFVYW